MANVRELFKSVFVAFKENVMKIATVRETSLIFISSLNWRTAGQIIFHSYFTISRNDEQLSTK